MNKKTIEILQRAKTQKPKYQDVAGATSEESRLNRIIELALAKLSKQPEPTEFTKRFKVLLDTQDKTSVVKAAYIACDIIECLTPEFEKRIAKLEKRLGIED